MTAIPLKAWIHAHKTPISRLRQNVFIAADCSLCMESGKVRPSVAGTSGGPAHVAKGSPGTGADSLHAPVDTRSGAASAGNLELQVPEPMLSEIRWAVDIEISKHGDRIDRVALERLRKSVASAIDAAVAQRAARHVAILKAMRDSFLAMPHVRAVAYQPIGRDAWKVAFVHDNEDDYAEIYKITDRIIEVERTLEGFVMDPRILTMDYVERDGLGDWGTVIFDRRHEDAGDRKRK